MEKTKILIVDDHIIARNGLRSMLEFQSDFIPELQEAKSGAEAVDLISKFSFDIVLLDLEMPKVDGFKTLCTLRENGVNTPIIIFSFHADVMLVERARSCGANGYLPKGASIEELTQGILQALKGGEFVNILGDGIKMPCTNDKVNLTKRETQVLILIADERNNIEIADELGISIRTVEGHKKNLTDKLMVKGSVGLTKYALKHGIIRKT